MKTFCTISLNGEVVSRTSGEEKEIEHSRLIALLRALIELKRGGHRLFRSGFYE